MYERPPNNVDDHLQALAHISPSNISHDTFYSALHTLAEAIRQKASNIYIDGAITSFEVPDIATATQWRADGVDYLSVESMSNGLRTTVGLNAKGNIVSGLNAGWFDLAAPADTLSQPEVSAQSLVLNDVLQLLENIPAPNQTKRTNLQNIRVEQGIKANRLCQRILEHDSTSGPYGDKTLLGIARIIFKSNAPPGSKSNEQQGRYGIPLPQAALSTTEISAESAGIPKGTTFRAVSGPPEILHCSPHFLTAVKTGLNNLEAILDEITGFNFYKGSETIVELTPESSRIISADMPELIALLDDRVTGKNYDPGTHATQRTVYGIATMTKASGNYHIESGIHGFEATYDPTLRRLTVHKGDADSFNELLTHVKSAIAGLHADQDRLNVGKPSSDI